jgi:predicted acetyltransferase
MLRPLRLTDEHAFVHAQRTMAEFDGFQFGLFYTTGIPFDEYLTQLEDRRVMTATNDRVPSTFLVAEVDGDIVGRVSIRHELNDFLRRIGGHIGYGVLPDFRRRGYATEILQQSLDITRTMGLTRVMLTCDDDNVASAKTIERCGGRLAAVVPADDPADSPIRQYWIGSTDPTSYGAVASM